MHDKALLLPPFFSLGVRRRVQLPRAHRSMRKDEVSLSCEIEREREQGVRRTRRLFWRPGACTRPRQRQREIGPDPVLVVPCLRLLLLLLLLLRSARVFLTVVACCLPFSHSVLPPMLHPLVHLSLQRAFTTIVLLSDQFDGGETSFPRLGLELKVGAISPFTL